MKVTRPICSHGITWRDLGHNYSNALMFQGRKMSLGKVTWLDEVPLPGGGRALALTSGRVLYFLPLWLVLHPSSASQNIILTSKLRFCNVMFTAKATRCHLTNAVARSDPAAGSAQTAWRAGAEWWFEWSGGKRAMTFFIILFFFPPENQQTSKSLWIVVKSWWLCSKEDWV